MRKCLFFLLALFMVWPLSAGAEGASPHTVVDCYGREVVLPGRVEAIAATGSSARLLTYAGVADQLVGVTDLDKSGEVGMPYAAVNQARFQDLPSVGAGGSKDVDYHEALVMLSPDVVFCNKDLDGVNDLAAKTGLPVIGLNYTGVFDESVYQSLQVVGQVMGVQVRTQQVIEALQDWQADLDARTRDISERPSCYTGGVGFKGPHGFEGSYAQYPPFVAVHANNVLDETGQSGALLIDLEQVLLWDPEVIFLNPSNMYLVNEDYEKNPAFYEGLSAVQAGRVYSQISYNYNSTNIEIAVADAYYAGKVLYPEAFADIDVVEKADEIFELMLGEPFYERLAQAGMRFEPLEIGG